MSQPFRFDANASRSGLNWQGKTGYMYGSGLPDIGNGLASSLPVVSEDASMQGSPVKDISIAQSQTLQTNPGVRLGWIGQGSHARYEAMQQKKRDEK